MRKTSISFCGYSIILAKLKSVSWNDAFDGFIETITWQFKSDQNLSMNLILNNIRKSDSKKEGVPLNDAKYSRETACAMKQLESS